MAGSTCKDLLHFSDAMSDAKRVMIITELMRGQALSASFLSKRLNMSPQATRFHLKRLEDAKLILFRTCGRHHYYEIKDWETASFIEAVFHILPPATSLVVGDMNKKKEFKEARTCYKHLAGLWSVKLTNALIQKKLMIIEDDMFYLTAYGCDILKNNNLLPDKCSSSDLSGKRCIDFTEHRDHIGGALGTLMLKSMIEKKWLQQENRCRELTITTVGYKYFNAIINYCNKI